MTPNKAVRIAAKIYKEVIEAKRDEKFDRHYGDDIYWKGVEDEESWNLEMFRAEQNDFVAVYNAAVQLYVASNKTNS